jgi:hypothetical protein
MQVQAHKQTSKAQTIEILTNPQVLNNPSKYKVAMLKVRYPGGDDTKQNNYHEKTKHAQKPMA